MVKQIYPHELKLNKANTIETEAPLFRFTSSVANGFVSSNIYYFDFDKVNFSFFDGDVPRRAPYGVYISQ